TLPSSQGEDSVRDGRETGVPQCWLFSGQAELPCIHPLPTDPDPRYPPKDEFADVRVRHAIRGLREYRMGAYLHHVVRHATFLPTGEARGLYSDCEMWCGMALKMAYPVGIVVLARRQIKVAETASRPGLADPTGGPGIPVRPHPGPDRNARTTPSIGSSAPWCTRAQWPSRGATQAQGLKVRHRLERLGPAGDGFTCLQDLGFEQQTELLLVTQDEIRDLFRVELHQATARSVHCHEVGAHDQDAHLLCGAIERTIAFHADDAVHDGQVRRARQGNVHDAIVDAAPVQLVLRPAIADARQRPEE